MTERFSPETVVGHGIRVKTYQPEPLFKNLQTPEKRIEIAVGDVDSPTVDRISMSHGEFEQIIEWYEA